MFGQQSNQQQGGGFGGFGTNNNTGSAFGQPQNTSFGGTTANNSGSLFGNNNSGFGSGAPAFGAAASNSTPFGANRPGFGAAATTSGGLFSGNNGTATAGASTGFGGFGNNNSNTTSGGLFGAPNKPAFGGSSTPGGGLFGGGAGATGFGAQNTQPTSAFGAPLGSALGVNSADCQGTGSTPFQAYTEKEGQTNQTNHFQSISFMQPYKNFSFEESRLADYNQGRRFGNGSGQAGAFGAATGFGGFGQQNNTAGGFGSTPAAGGGLFGSQPTNAATPFGSAQAGGSAFGTGNTGGGLFGQKPATPSLFGGANTTSSQPSGSLFGTTGQTGFGTTQAGSSGGLFGTAQPQQPAKPGFSFPGATNNNGFGTGGNGFGTSGNANNAAGSLFGSGQTASPFGGGQQQQPAVANPFGGFASNQQSQNQPATGSVFGGFGQAQPKPGGLFGPPSTTANNASGLFGATQNNQQQPATTGLWGAAASNQPSGTSLFGKPAAASTSLFGNPAPNNTNNTGTGGFGNFGTNNNNAQNQQNQGGLFGTANNQQQQKPSMFNNGSATGGGVFGTSNTNNQQPAGGSVFGNLGSNNQQQQSGGLFGNANNGSSSLFNNSQQQPNALQPPQALTTNINAYAPWGSSSIFDGLPPPPRGNPGPLATPISIGNKMKKSAVLPPYKINPNATSRLVTPQKRGYGFSYSTYGTPSSISSNASTPGGLSSSLMYGSVGRGLGKSLSTSNLRRSFDSDQESILLPGAFSAGSSRYSASGTGSLKRLTIDRSLRTDLFGNQNVGALPSTEKVDQSRQAGILKKKVSFDASTVGGNGMIQNETEANGINGSAISGTPTSATPSAQEQGFLRSSARTNGRLAVPKSNGAPAQSEMEQVKGNELAIVHEDGSPESSTKTSARPLPQIPQADPEPGAYYMKPSRQELSKMPKSKQKQVAGFSVGREGCGHVTFDQPVDLTSVDLDHIYGNIAVIETRSLTVYPELDKKPPLGQGLNVPSTIYLENSWPRTKDRKTPSHEKSGPRFNKHVDRLRKVTGTEFVEYDKDTGTWVFKVPHFTTYALDFDETESEGDSMHTSTLSEFPDTPTPKSRTPQNGYTPTPTAYGQDSSFLTDDLSRTSSSPDDTFEFRKKKVLPGAFDDTAIFEDDHDMETSHHDESFLDERLAASPSESSADEPSVMQDVTASDQIQPLIVLDEMDMAGSFPQPGSNLFNSSGLQSPPIPHSILKPSQHENVGFGTPVKLRFHGSGDWANQLQRTISPRKQDRQTLRESQAHMTKDLGITSEITPQADLMNGTGQVLTTSIDLMNSLFGQELARKSGRGVKQAKKGKGFKWPYPKGPKNDNDYDDMSEVDRDFHRSFKPSWAPGATIVYAMPSKTSVSRSKVGQSNPIFLDQKGTFVSEGRDVRFAKLAVTSALIPQTLIKQRASTKVVFDRGIPAAEVQRVPLSEIASNFGHTSDKEQFIWQLAAMLFDDEDSEALASVPAGDRAAFAHRARKDRLSGFWQHLCQESAKKAADAAPNAEERAIAYLSANQVVEACDALVKGKDFRLAILVSQIGGDVIMRDDIATQINDWRELNVLSEMTEPIRALYGLLAGNTCICEGKKGQLEDRAKTFTLSDRFRLDWKRAFGLRLWYAVLEEEPIEAAVKKYADDIAADEHKKPIPWFMEEDTDHSWRDGVSAQGEDLLWGFLKLYAASKGSLEVNSIADIVMPHNATGNPLDARFSFQLYHAISLRFPNKDTAKADQIARDFAVQLESAGEWIWAIFAVLHLSDRIQRQQALQSLLAHHSQDITDSESQRFRILTEEFKIPASWIWEAKALHARSVLQNHAREVNYLCQAKNWDEAHETFCRTVGPKLIIEQDYGTLQGLLDGFKGKDMVHEWGLGGQIYADFLNLVKGITGQERTGVLKRLLSALPTMVRERPGKMGFKEMVAVQTMSGIVGKMVLEGKDKGLESAKVLQLPLTQDTYLKNTLDLSFQYYKAVMAGGR